MQTTDHGKRKPALGQAGGTKGLVLSALPPVVFVVANNAGGHKVGVLAALLVALGIAVRRLTHREPIQPALGGVFGVAMAAGISWYAGSAKGFIFFGIWPGPSPSSSPCCCGGPWLARSARWALPRSAWATRSSPSASWLSPGPPRLPANNSRT
ncbi:MULTISPECIES: DUF3159 domain-containing protein [unclassified Streptomyces]|uniref:DUF3159 domain-containing protein n=1 Tax=unclassified Streptomyces TaxID=2593676 RepID=UPI003662658D